MKNLQHLRATIRKTGNNTYILDVMNESSVREVIAEAVGLAIKLNGIIQFVFCNVTVNVNPRSDSDLVYRNWSANVLRTEFQRKSTV